MKEVVTIIEYDHYGRGIGKINDKIIFIPDTMLNEKVEVDITLNKKNYMEGKVISFIHKNDKHQQNLCLYYNVCGGCDILHLPYDEQLNFKYRKVQNIIQKYTKIEFKINNIVKSDKQFYYRNKVTFHQDKNKIGFFKKNSQDIININKCLLLDKQLNLYLNSKQNKIKTKQFSLRTNGQVVLDNNRETIIKKIGNKYYKVSLESFFQVNDNITLKMYEKVKEYCNASKDDNILDLYCGTGTIGIYVSDNCHKVLGVELNKQAIKNANENKKINHIQNIDFIAGDVSNVLKNINFDPSIIIVDPPRSGLDKNTIRLIIKLKPLKLIYISCDPMTLARDINFLKEKFIIKELTPFDMFPNTYHVECVVLLQYRT